MKNLKSLNKALLCKWSWRFANEKGALWIEVIKGKYGGRGGGGGGGGGLELLYP